jgi:hypothetical protein
MFKKVISGFSKFFTKERVIILLAFLVLIWALYYYSGSKTMVIDRMSDGSVYSNPVSTDSTAATAVTAPTPTPTAPSNIPNGYTSQSVGSNPSDLLPIDTNPQWGSLNPSSMNQGDILMPDLLQAGYHIGLDTIGQSLRNPNLQLRSDPIIPKTDIGPWNQSTIEPDLGRVPLEIGPSSK